MCEFKQFGPEEFEEWLADKHPSSVVGKLDLRSENSPLGHFLKRRFQQHAVYLGVGSWVFSGKVVSLPIWAARFESLMDQMPAGTQITAAEALRLLRASLEASLFETEEEESRQCFS